MRVQTGAVVTLSYELRLDDGQVVDSTADEGPLSYIHGNGTIIAGLERQMEGMESGESRQIILSASEGYGEVDPGMILELPRNEVAVADILRPGMRLSFTDKQGKVLRAMVQRIEQESIVLDANHPLAGQKLHFDIKVEDVRKATPLEMEGLRTKD